MLGGGGGGGRSDMAQAGGQMLIKRMPEGGLGRIVVHNDFQPAHQSFGSFAGPKGCILM